MQWIGFQLPYRACQGTYDVYSQQPPVNSTPYSKVTLDNLECLKESRSPTACYVDREGDVFYRDQQDCVLWKLIEGKVYADDDLVADSLAEFCARVILENRIWFATIGRFSQVPAETLVQHDPEMLAYVLALKQSVQ